MCAATTSARLQFHTTAGPQLQFHTTAGPQLQFHTTAGPGLPVEKNYDRNVRSSACFFFELCVGGLGVVTWCAHVVCIALLPLEPCMLRLAPAPPANGGLRGECCGMRSGCIDRVWQCRFKKHQKASPTQRLNARRGCKIIKNKMPGGLR